MSATKGGGPLIVTLTPVDQEILTRALTALWHVSLDSGHVAINELCQRTGLTHRGRERDR